MSDELGEPRESDHGSDNESLQKQKQKAQRRHQKSQKHQQQQQQQLQLLSDSDLTDAVAPVEVSGLVLDPPTYDSPQASRQSLKQQQQQQQRGGGPGMSDPRQTPAGAASASRSGAAELESEQPLRQRHKQSTETTGASSYSTDQRRSNDRTARQPPEESPQGSRCCEILLMILSGLLIVLTFPFSLFASIKIVQQYERAVIFRLGRIQGPPKGPGLFFIFICVDKMQVVDLRTITFDVPPQEILTKDSVTVAVDAVIYYRIFDPIKATVDIENVHNATRLLAQTTLRNTLGTKTLHDILAERDAIAHAMQETLDCATDPWGVKVERVEVKDVRLPVQMQRAMAAEAEALREAKAKVIAAEGEQKASRALKEAADVINESPAALQLRYLQTLNTIAAEKNSTIIFPLPIELMKAVMGKNK